MFRLPSPKISVIYFYSKVKITSCRLNLVFSPVPRISPISIGKIRYTMIQLFRKSLKIINYALSLNDSTLATHSGWEGAIWSKLRRFRKAEESFEKAHILRPKNPINSRNKALFYAIKRRPSKAIEFLKEAADKGYPDWVWLEKEKAFSILSSIPSYQNILKTMNI